MSVLASVLLGALAVAMLTGLGCGQGASRGPEGPGEAAHGPDP